MGRIVLPANDRTAAPLDFCHHRLSAEPRLTACLAYMTAYPKQSCSQCPTEEFCGLMMAFQKLSSAASSCRVGRNGDRIRVSLLYFRHTKFNVYIYNLCLGLLHVACFALKSVDRLVRGHRLFALDVGQLHQQKINWIACPTSRRRSWSRRPCICSHE